MDFPTLIKEKTETIESYLEQLLPENHLPEQLLYEAARYSVLGGGKRIRPLLTLLTNEALGGTMDHALTPACALELIHTYSLIHDDLPCMDDDDFRRGKPSLHKQYSEGHAVLTGDYLLTYAFEIISRAPHLSSDQKLELVNILAKCAGASGMIGGQVLDIQQTGKQMSFDELTEIHNKKTGALISAAVLFGAVCGNASSQQREALLRFSKHIGLAFQIVDDILDVTHVNEKRGGSTSSDVKNNKTTYVSLLGYDQARIKAKESIQAALMELASFGDTVSSLVSLSEFLLLRTK